VLALAARHTGPELGGHARRLLVEGQDEGTRDQHFEGLELPLERLPVADRKAVSTQTFKDRDRGDRQTAEALQVGERAPADDGVASTQLGEGVGIEDDGLVPSAQLSGSFSLRVNERSSAAGMSAKLAAARARISAGGGAMSTSSP
jgi:hypothetical protein